MAFFAGGAASLAGAFFAAVVVAGADLAGVVSAADFFAGAFSAAAFFAVDFSAVDFAGDVFAGAFFAAGAAFVAAGAAFLAGALLAGALLAGALFAAPAVLAGCRAVVVRLATALPGVGTSLVVAAVLVGGFAGRLARCCADGAGSPIERALAAAARNVPAAARPA